MARREEVVIATKVGLKMGESPNQAGLSRKHILEGIDASLKRLGTDYVDLYQIHRLDRSTPMEEICAALDCVVRAGKALYIGASSMWAWEFMKMLSIQDRNGLARFSSMQNHYNLLYREEEREMMPLCQAEGIAVMPWSPLARGVLTKPPAEKSTIRAKSDTFTPKLYGLAQDRRIIAALAKVAAGHGVSQAQAGLAWHLAKPWVTAPIVGATRLEQLDEAIAATALRLSPRDVAALERPYGSRSEAGFE